MARFNQKQTLLIIIGSAVLLCSGAGGGVYWAKGLIEEEKIQIAAKDKEIDAGNRKIKMIPQVEDDVIILRENVAHYVRVLPKEAELSKFTRKAQDFAVNSGILQFDRYTPLRAKKSNAAFQRVTYQFQFTATLWQFMTFMNFFETYERFVSVRDYTLTQGKKESSDEDTKHSIRMTVETYLYNPQGATTLVKIPNYDTKVQRLRLEIEAGKQLADLGEPYKFQGREGRRDIFVDPRMTVGEGEGPVATMAEQRRLIEDASKEVAELQSKYDQSTSPERTVIDKIELLRDVKLGLQKLSVKLSEVSDRKLIRNPSLNSRWYREVQVPFKALRAKVDKANVKTDIYLSRGDFKKLIDSLKDLLADGELKQAVARYSAVRSKIEVPNGHPSFDARKKVESLILQAKVALQFAQVPLQVGGVLVTEGGRSGVILNGQVYEEGEYLNEELFVKAVRNEEVEFVYKGFTLVRTF